jgi:hypothetical protein
MVRDNAAVTGLSLVVQLAIIIAALVVATTHMPNITPENLGADIPSFAFTNLFFVSQFHFISELSKFVDNKFDGLERYK